jgi:hypothetical protein
MKSTFKQYFVLFVSLLFSIEALAQSTYTNSARYWKNRKPDAGYWQQDIAYNIKAKVWEKENKLSASEVLEYTNNSPDTLSELYFHLYQNAFNKGSYLDQLYDANKIKTSFGRHLDAAEGITVSNIKVNNEAAKYAIDNTILKISLDKKLLPNQKINIALDFVTYWDDGTIRRRMQMYNAWGFMHYNGVHWYPRIAVYDKKKGWDCDQHLNKELYGDFGTFDVELDFASNYVLEATGMLQNKNEVLPDALLEKLQLKNFITKPWNEKPSIITPYDANERKVWKYHADFVHDFAFTADPSYRYDIKEVYGVQCVACVQEPHASRWKNGAEYVTKIIKTLSDEFGMYEYPKMVAADANDGMEYPMITLDGGGDPDYRGLLVHEIAHNWFYGMIGNNETYRASLDEGFTQFATAVGLNKIDGPTMVETQDSRPFVRKHKNKNLVFERNFLSRYTNEVINGNDRALNTHSNDFSSALAHENGYGLVYHKTASMLLNLQYVLGDSLFKNAMQHYVEKWKFAHPYFEDFRQSIIEYTHVDLNWFFDQWLETTKNIDYSVKKIKGRKCNNYDIILERKGSMQMPIDFTVVANNGAKYNYHVPNTNVFSKSTEGVVLPKWYGWHILNPTYTATVQIPSGIKYVQIDTTYRLADVNMQNNSRVASFKRNNYSVKTNFDFGVRNPASRRYAEAFWRPDVWWNPIDGLKLGINVQQAYMNSLDKWDASIWWNSHLLNQSGSNNFGKYYLDNMFSYIINYETILSKIHRKLNVGASAKNMDGLNRFNVYAFWQINESNRLRADIVSMYRKLGTKYQPFNNMWSGYADVFNIADGAYRSNDYLQLHWTKALKGYSSNTLIKTTLRAPLNILRSSNVPSFDYSYLQSEWIHKKRMNKLDFTGRFFAQLGMGYNIPTESALFLAGANPEQHATNKYTRSIWSSASNVTDKLYAFSSDVMGHMHQGGGLNLRGFNAYYAAEVRDGQTYSSYFGKSGAAVNGELEFDKLINWRPKKLRNWLHADTYIFADAGSMNLNIIDANALGNVIPTNKFSKLRIDAGIGAALTIKSWGRFEKAEPLTLRVDLPMFINRIPFAQNNTYFSLNRWVIGVNRSF